MQIFEYEFQLLTSFLAQLGGGDQRFGSTCEVCSHCIYVILYYCIFICQRQHCGRCSSIQLMLYSGTLLYLTVFSYHRPYNLYECIILFQLLLSSMRYREGSIVQVRIDNRWTSRKVRRNLLSFCVTAQQKQVVTKERIYCVFCCVCLISVTLVITCPHGGSMQRSFVTI